MRTLDLTLRNVLSLALVAACSVSAIGGCAVAEEEPSVTEDALDLRRATADRSTTLPIAEVSGLGARTIDGQTSYLAVGDSDTTLVTFDVSRSGKVRDVVAHDLSSLFGRGPSQWEAVAGDALGRVFVLAEGASTISVVSPDLTRVEHKITLTVGDPDDARRLRELGEAWETDDNSRGEGFLLLDNGHVLVAKEKAPAAIIELAPRGEAAGGYRPGMAVGGAGSFPLPRGSESELVAVHRWLIDRAAEDNASDLSEMAVDGEGRILLLSDQGRAILRIERDFGSGSNRVDVKAVHRLPSEIEKPEGLVLAGDRLLVASDERRARTKALFTLAPLR